MAFSNCDKLLKALLSGWLCEIFITGGKASNFEHNFVKEWIVDSLLIIHGKRKVNVCAVSVVSNVFIIKFK